MVASIPSPSTGTLDVGPLQIHLYGVTLLVAIVAAILLTGWRRGRREGDWDLIFRIGVWGVAAGIVGARLYHVVTSWDQVPDPKWKGVFQVWEGGLGVWGGILFGVLAGAFVVRRSGGNVRLAFDAVAPSLLLAQAIGRLGNWFNQELYGKPTDLPWALEIDDAHNGDYAVGTTFHPTFLYEMIWNLVGVAVLLAIERRFRIRPPGLFALYVAWYTFGRFFEELLRVDPAHEFLGLRVNAWVSVVLFVAAVAFFVWWQWLGPRREDRASGPRRPAMAIPKSRVRPSR